VIETDMTAFPNPSLGQLFVRISQLVPNERIYLFNQLGQQMMEFEAQNETYLSLENLTSGIYLLKYSNQTIKINLIN